MSTHLSPLHSDGIASVRGDRPVHRVADVERMLRDPDYGRVLGEQFAKEVVREALAESDH